MCGMPFTRDTGGMLSPPPAASPSTPGTSPHMHLLLLPCAQVKFQLDEMRARLASNDQLQEEVDYLRGFLEQLAMQQAGSDDPPSAADSNGSDFHQLQLQVASSPLMGRTMDQRLPSAESIAPMYSDAIGDVTELSLQLPALQQHASGQAGSAGAGAAGVGPGSTR
jgi:hypothetical protein